MNVPRSLAWCLIAFVLSACGSAHPGAHATGVPVEDVQAIQRWVELSRGEDRGEEHRQQRSHELSPASPEGNAPLALEEAVLHALSHNRNLLVERENVEIAGAFERIARGDFHPRLVAGAQVSRERASVTDRATQQRFDVEGEGARANLGVEQTLPSGTLLEVGLGFRRSDSDRSPEQQEARVELGVTQPLLRGVLPAANLAEVRQAALQTDATRFELRGLITSLLVETEAAYWELALSNVRLDIAQEELALAERRLEEIDARIEVGARASFERAAVEADVAQRRQALAVARGDLARGSLALAFLLGDRFEADSVDEGGALVALQPTTSPWIEGEPSAVTARRAYVESALLHRAEINQARLELQRRELQTVVTRNGRLPRLDVFVALARTGFADSFADAFQNLGGNTFEFTAGVQFEHLLGNTQGRARRFISEAERRQAELAVDNLEALIRREVFEALISLDECREQITATRLLRLAQERVTEGAEQRFSLGESTARELLEVRRDLSDARISEIEAQVAYRLAELALFAAEGTLIERRGVLAGQEDARTP